eukprot:TRINITY_DN2259_c0_g1_i1.p1 TRINITY_DN2259_c0_g1~~TRINITY_DN2259_c0_g1_i1.p1  ORF type:complete len:1177 (-),score=200.03 TRINITY_DN2259_c0_g1_i1:219-3749(-)
MNTSSEVEETEQSTRLFGIVDSGLAGHLTFYDLDAPFAPVGGVPTSLSLTESFNGTTPTITPTSMALSAPMSQAPPHLYEPYTPFNPGQPPAPTQQQLYYPSAYTHTPPTTPEGNPMTSPLDSPLSSSMTDVSHPFASIPPRQQHSPHSTVPPYSYTPYQVNPVLQSTVKVEATSSPSSQWSPPTTEPSSPVETPPIRPTDDPEMWLTLSHKPRGSGGVWKAVPEGNALRVTKDKGKRLRLLISCNFEFDWDEVYITLVDHVTMVDARSGFNMDLSKCTLQQNAATIELTLTRICKKLQFHVTLKSKFGWTCQGHTVSFLAHNNGKETSRVKTEKNPKSTVTPVIPGMGVNMGRLTAGSSASAQSVAFPHAPLSTSKSASQQTVVRTPLGRTDTTKKRKIGEAGEGRSETVTIVKNDLEVAGTVRAHDFIQYSDLRLKTDIKDVVDALAIVQQLQPKTYQWKKDAFTVANKEGADAAGNLSDISAGGRRLIGLIAQEVQQLVPDAVHTDPATGLLSVSYIDLLPILIQALKEHLTTYEVHQADVSCQIQDLHQKLAALSVSDPKPESPSDKIQPTNEDSSPAVDEDVKENAENQVWQESVGKIRERTDDFKALSSSDLSMLTEWADHLRLRHARRDARQQLRQQRRESHQRKTLQESSEEDLLLYPMRLQRDVMSFGERIFRSMSKHRVQLAAVLFWTKSPHNTDLAMTLSLSSEDNPCRTVRSVKEDKKLKWSVLGLPSGKMQTQQQLDGTYRIYVRIDSGDVLQLQQARAVVAVYDYSTAGQTPLSVTSTSITYQGNSKYWLVGTFQLQRAVLKWLSTPNTAVAKLPVEWKWNQKSQSAGLSVKTTPAAGLAPPAPIKTNPLSKSLELVPCSPLVMRETTRVFLRSSNGYYFTCSPKGQVTCCKPAGGMPGIAETWELEFGKSGIVSLRGQNGRLLRRTTFENGPVATADSETRTPRGSDVFIPLIDDQLHTLSFIAHDAMYIYCDANGCLTKSPLAQAFDQPPADLSPPPASSAKKKQQQAMPMGSSLELYKQLSKGALSILPGQQPISMGGSTDFYLYLQQGAETHNNGGMAAEGFTQPRDNESADLHASFTELNGSLELYKQLSEGASKSAIPAAASSIGDQSLAMAFTLPREEQLWTVEAAPSREVQQAQQAQAAWQKLQQARPGAHKAL